MLKSKTQGFSLLELIIVLVIIGVLVAAITISLGDNRGDKLRLEARRLAARIALARDEAILTNQEYGLEITQDGYRFLELKEQRWQVINGFAEKQFIQQDLPEGMEIQLNVEGLFAQFESQQVTQLFKDYDESDAGIGETEQQDPDDEFSDNELDNELDREAQLEAQKRRPQIYLMTSGEINPFTLLIGFDDDNAIYYQLTASFDGEIKLTGPLRDAFLQLATPNSDLQ